MKLEHYLPSAEAASSICEKKRRRQHLLRDRHSVFRKQPFLVHGREAIRYDAHRHEQHPDKYLKDHVLYLNEFQKNRLLFSLLRFVND